MQVLAQTRDIAVLGQVFTPPAVVSRMLVLCRNAGRTLEPACGDGAFWRHFSQCVGIELDRRHCPQGGLNIDFFSYPEHEKFDTVIGNPPYVKARDILPATRLKLRSRLLNGHANLYFYFIEKCVRHLKPGGELVFITPRDFFKATGAALLNSWLFDQGSFTEVIELGDARVFPGAVPNCVIWRFEKGNRTRRLSDGRRMRHAAGQLMFTRSSYSVPLGDIFVVRVGAVSGADEIYTHAALGNSDFVCSRTAQTGELRRMILPGSQPLPYLEQFKERLLARRVARFDESNWWRWGRRHYESSAPRIYVNSKTRNPRPFFLNECPNYDGSVLALFPKKSTVGHHEIAHLAELLNGVDWREMGFVCDGRFLFAQRSLEQALLPEVFAPYAK